MKRFFISLCAVFALTLSNVDAQKIPSKLLKGIEQINDEFTGATTYSCKGCILRIEANDEDVSMYINLSCFAFDAPIELEKIYIATNGESIVIDDATKFTQKEQPQRYMSRMASGTFGTSSYRPAEFATRIAYVDEFEDDATTHMKTINSIVEHGGKIKFEGRNNNAVSEFSTKEIKQLKSLLALYDYLKK